MPGIITHNKIFIDSINHLKKGKNKGVYSRSLEALFKSDSFIKAGLFGAIGPNIFDYIPFLKDNHNSGKNISYELHSIKSEEFLKTILLMITSYKDLNTEWSSTQKAYFYGLISHFISDSIFHPFVYYWSGFPDFKIKKDLPFFREQHLLFEYNMDMFFNQNTEESNKKLNFDINQMLPLTGKGSFKRVDPAIKAILLKSIRKMFPEFYKKFNILKSSEETSPLLFFLDIIPILIKFTYRVKKSRNSQLAKIISYIKKKKLFHSDFLVNYPSPNKINTNILNLHKERWFHPTGASGLHYESAADLLLISSIKTAEVWKKLEEFFYTGGKDVSGIENELKINPLTGIFGKDISSMQIQNPIHLRF